LDKVLIDRGWYVFHVCQCAGGRKDYKHQDYPYYEIKCYTKRGFCEVFKKGKKVPVKVISHFLNELEKGMGK